VAGANNLPRTFKSQDQTLKLTSFLKSHWRVKAFDHGPATHCVSFAQFYLRTNQTDWEWHQCL
jgi:hypothetical protein